MLDLLEEFRPFVDGLVLRVLNRRQIGPLDFERRGGAALEEILAEGQGEEARTADPAAAGRTGPEPAEALAPATDLQAATEGVYLAGAGRRIFLTEFFRRLRERLYYPPRGGAFELRDIVREQAYHLARVIEGKDPAYVPFVPA